MARKKETITEKIMKRIFPNIFNKIDSLEKQPTNSYYDRPFAMLGTNFELNKLPLPKIWFYNPGFGIPRNVDTTILRQFSMTAPARLSIDTVIEEICGLEWDIVPKKDFVENYNEEIRKKIYYFFKYPNPDSDFIHMMRKLLDDILSIDAGVLVKVFSKDSKLPEKAYDVEKNIWKNNKLVSTKTTKIMAKQIYDLDRINIVPEKYEEGTPTSELVALRVADGATILKAPNEFGMLPETKPAYYQYSFIHPNGTPIPFFKREIVYFSMNPMSNSFYGKSPLESLYNILEIMSNSERFNKSIFDENAMPDGIMTFEGMPKEEIKKIRRAWMEQLKGKPHKILFSSHKGDFKQLTMTAKDMQWLEGQKFYMKFVFGAYHLNQGELGFTDELNKHSSGEQSNILYRKMIKPLAILIETKFNNEIIPEFYKSRGMEIETEFKYHLEDKVEKQQLIQNGIAMVNAGIITPNEMRVELGKQPIDGGDDLKKPQQFNPFVSQEKPKEEPKKKVKILKAKPNMELEAKNYADFLKKYYSFIEKKVISALKDKTFGIEKKITKSLPEFISSVTSYLDPEFSRDSIRRSIKNTFLEGISKGEEETGIQIGYQENFNPRVDSLTEEQIYGYVLPDGKRWFGIKGINQQLQNNIYDTVKSGMVEGKSLKQITEDIKKLFDTFKDWRATRIARTETTRIANQGSYTAYIESGLSGKREWLATIDSRTCPICKRLNGQKVELNKAFTDKLTGKQYYHAPVHPNCFDKDTEVLSNEGWKLFKDLKGTEKILSVNLKNGNSEWTDINKIISYKYSGDLVYYKNISTDLMITPDHNQVVKFRKKKHGRKDADKWLLKREDELPNHDFNFLATIPNYKGKDKKFIEIGDFKCKTKDFVEFLGYYLSEGNLSKPLRGSYQIKITQNKSRYYDKMVNNAKKIFERVWAGKDSFYIPIKDEKLINWFKKLGKANDKYIPEEIKKLDKKYLKIFLDAYLLGDGNVKKGKVWKGYQFNDSRTYFTISNKLASDIGELLLKIGKRPSYTKQKDGFVKFKNGTYFSHGCWRISENKFNPSREYMIKELIPYNDYVYDVELVKNHTLFIRRNGKVLCSGNCRCTMVFVPDEV